MNTEFDKEKEKNNMTADALLDMLLPSNDAGFKTIIEKTEKNLEVHQKEIIDIIKNTAMTHLGDMFKEKVEEVLIALIPNDKGIRVSDLKH